MTDHTADAVRDTVEAAADLIDLMGSDDAWTVAAICVLTASVEALRADLRGAR